MDNQALCRGKTVDGNVVYGYYAFIEDKHFILANDHRENGLSSYFKEEVLPETIERCSGIVADKSCRGSEPTDLLIFEGDIVMADGFRHVVDVGMSRARTFVNCYIKDVFHLERGRFEFICKLDKFGRFTFLGDGKTFISIKTASRHYEIIGSIHDEPPINCENLVNQLPDFVSDMNELSSMSDEEIRADLEAGGVDVEKFLARVRETVKNAKPN